jgi:hypothetical protein
MTSGFKALALSAVAAACVLPGASVAAEWKHPKTPWGDPDLRGMWPVAHLISVPLQRPTKYGDRLHFTEEEMAEQRKAVEARNKRYEEEDSQDRIGMGHWAEVTGLPTQTSLIVDPPNGRLPPQTEAGKQQSAKMGSSWNRKVFDSITDFDTWDRCITRGMPASMFPFQYNNGIQIVQSPGYVVINMEMVHEARIVPVGKVPALDGEVKQWLGSSRGRWEGNTLVVETTHFNGEISMTSAGTGTTGGQMDPRATSTQLKIVERFERTSADDLTYTVTVEDPVTQTSSWTARLPWKRNDSYQFFEYACHEDNEAIRNYITASRADRAKEAAKK